MTWLGDVEKDLKKRSIFGEGIYRTEVNVQ